MTVQLIRRTAKEFAGAFYEAERSAMFRRAFPTASDFIHGRAHKRDGSILKQDPNWWQFVDMAKQTLAKMLGSNGVSEHEKAAIYDALCDEAERGSRANARRVFQNNLEKREDKLPEFVR